MTNGLLLAHLNLNDCLFIGYDLVFFFVYMHPIILDFQLFMSGKIKAIFL